MAENNNDQVADLPKSPNAALKTLEPLIGRWRISGPDVSGEATYEWMEGGFFFIQRFDLTNFGSRHKGVEYSGWDDETRTIRSRLMGTDGSRFTYTYEMRGDELSYWFGEKDADTYSRGRFSADGRRVEGRWTIQGAPGGGYDWIMERLD